MVTKRILVLAAACASAIAIVGAQPVKADSPDASTSISGWANGATNALLGELPAPSGWHPRHVCMGLDLVNWGECITFPFPY
jgi:hypothetical protein